MKGSVLEARPRIDELLDGIESARQDIKSNEKGDRYDG